MDAGGKRHLGSCAPHRGLTPYQFQRGYRWTASSREEPVPPLRGLANRVDQATTNFLETFFPFFAALVLIAHVINHHSALTIWGVHLYFWARLAYLIAAAIGLGLVRSLVCWNTAFVALRCSLSRCSEEDPC
jgi:uncharacterized MAPEG superfamily protein